jgi:hypothetical protein
VLRADPQNALEPSFGAGAFLLPLIEHFMDRQSDGSLNTRLGRVLTEHVWGVEIDPELYDAALERIRSRWGALPAEHNLVLGDYFRFEPGPRRFDLIVGNPPFGGTFDRDLEDQLDRRFGRYDGAKLKKETYSFFTAKALTELTHDGQLAFICSDTFLTIKTMAGLRRLLIDSGSCVVERLHTFSDETIYDMVTIALRAGPRADRATVLGAEVTRESMESTGNFSWTINERHGPLFRGATIGDYLVATGGMTIGRNELFVREVIDGAIEEHLDFAFAEEPVTLAGEIERARLGKLSANLRERIRAQEAAGVTRRIVVTTERERPLRHELPHPDYRLYNKANPTRLYADPTHAVYWKDGGDAVLTFKKSGPWYLHGVGGMPFFEREGLTWQLVSQRINARYLPAGYILDSGAPCAFLRDGVSHDELWFVLGWLQTPLATEVLKDVLNHTRNIQGKDIERLPYPWWVPPWAKRRAVEIVRDAVLGLQSGEEVDRETVGGTLADLYSVDERLARPPEAPRAAMSDGISLAHARAVAI